MASLTTIVETSTRALGQVTPQTLTTEQLTGSIQTLRDIQINDAIDDYWRTLPTKPDNESEVPDWEKLIHAKAKELNHLVSDMNHELNRVKEMRSALDIPQLDELIHAAQQIIRPIYNFTAQLNN